MGDFEGENQGEPTGERLLKGDLERLGEERGGVRGVYARSVLDVLVENEIITATEREFGLAYWRLKESAFAFLGISVNPLYAEIPSGDEPPPPQDGQLDAETAAAEDGRSVEVFLILSRKLLPHYRSVLNCACAPAIGPEHAMIWAFGEWTIRQAFEVLERFLPAASKEYEERIKQAREKIRLDRERENA